MLTLKYISLVLFGTFYGMSAAFADSPSDVAFVVGEKTDHPEKITKEEIDRLMKEISAKGKKNGEEPKALSEDEKKSALENILFMYRLVSWAKSQKLGDSPEVQAAIKQAYVSAAFNKLRDEADKVTEDELNKMIAEQKKDPEIMKSIFMQTVVVDKKQKSEDKTDVEQELKNLENLKGEGSEKTFKSWAEKFQVSNPNGQYNESSVTMKVLKANPQLSEMLKGLEAGNVKIIPLGKSSLVLVVRVIKKDVRTEENEIKKLAEQQVKANKMKQLVKNIEEKISVKKVGK